MYMKKDTEEDSEENINKQKFVEGLNTYYRLKNEYIEYIHGLKQSIIGIPDLSWKEKRIEYHKIKPKW